MGSGWIKLYRSLLDDPVWVSATTDQKAVLITILLLASHEQRQWYWQGRKFEVKPGQMITSLASLSSKAGVSIKSVRSAIARFEKIGFLANESAKTGRLISIINWSTYQAVFEEGGKEGGKVQAKSGQLTIMEKVKKKDNSSPDAFRLSTLLAEKIAQNNPSNLSIGEAKIDKSIRRWAKDIDRMLRIDGRCPKEVETVIQWSQSDSFWKSNILSGAKLRAQFDQLVLKCRQDGMSMLEGTVRRVF